MQRFTVTQESVTASVTASFTVRADGRAIGVADLHASGHIDWSFLPDCTLPSARTIARLARRIRRA